MYMSWCGCWCEETPISSSCNCNIIAADNTKVVTTWNDIVVSSPFYRVISSDSTVWVTTTTTASPNETVFDLSKPCCPDRLVAVAPECTTWWTIKDVIQVDTSWPLTWTQNWCNNWQLWFNSSLLNNKDEKVKWKSSCTPVFWDQLLTAWTWIKIEDVWCKWRISVTDAQWIRPFLKRYLESNVTVSYSHWNQADLPNNWWFPINTSEIVDSWWFFASANEYTINPNPKPWSTSNWGWDVWWFVIPKTGFYNVFMNANIWVNRWVESCRVALIALKWWSYKVLLNIWYSSPNAYSLAEFQTTNDPLWDPTEWYIWNWNHSSNTFFFEQWDIIYGMFGRMNNLTLAWPWTATTSEWLMWVFTWPFWFNPFWSWNQEPADPEYWWTYWWIERKSNEIWDARYFKE